jgi:hypothetical protein
MFVEKSALSILPDEPAIAQICTADSPLLAWLPLPQ